MKPGLRFAPQIPDKLTRCRKPYWINWSVSGGGDFGRDAATWEGPYECPESTTEQTPARDQAACLKGVRQGNCAPVLAIAVDRFMGLIRGPNRFAVSIFKSSSV